MTPTDDPAVAVRTGGRTYHLTPEAVWAAQEGEETYRPEAFAEEHFVHCADGEVNLLAAANRYYQGDKRPHVILVVDLGRVTAPVRYEDPDRIYPHVYGPLNRDAVAEVRRAVRLADGSFVGIS